MNEQHALRVPVPTIDQFAMENYLRELRIEQSLFFGSVGGLLGALAGAGLWAVVTVITDWQTGWMAVPVGVLVGLGVRQFGRGIDRRFGFVGAALAPAGCVLGNLLAGSTLISAELGVPLIAVVAKLVEEPDLALKLLGVMFSPVDLVFYALAVYGGYRFSFRRAAPDALARFAGKAS